MRKKLPEFKEKLDTIFKNSTEDYMTQTEIIQKLVAQEKNTLILEEPGPLEREKARRKASSGSTRDEEISEDEGLKCYLIDRNCNFH